MAESRPNPAEDHGSPPRPPGPEAGKVLQRAWARQVSKTLTPGEISTASEAICAHLAGICADLAAGKPDPCLMVYVPIRGEIDPILLASWAFRSGWRVCVGYGRDREDPLQPVTISPAFIEGGVWQVDGPAATVDAWGMAVPRDHVPVRPASLTAVVVPGLAFDERCHRLGRGAGVYDRFLAELDPRTRRLGVAPEARIAPALATDPHDIPMHAVATERRVIFLPPDMAQCR
ncbi:MAG: 5-formyltetrahydrofolate cyclo-ligase [Phycisphaerales bacterium]